MECTLRVHQGADGDVRHPASPMTLNVVSWLTAYVRSRFGVMIASFLATHALHLHVPARDDHPCLHNSPASSLVLCWFHMVLAESYHGHLACCALTTLSGRPFEQACSVVQEPEGLMALQIASLKAVNQQKCRSDVSSAGMHACVVAQ